MSKDKLSEYINHLAGEIRQTEGVAMQNRELLTHDAVANIEAFLRGQLDIMVSNLKMLAISAPLPAVGSFSISTPVAVPVPTAAASREPTVVKPVPAPAPTPRPTAPGRLPRATPEDLKDDHKATVPDVSSTDADFLEAE